MLTPEIIQLLSCQIFQRTKMRDINRFLQTFLKDKVKKKVQINSRNPDVVIHITQAMKFYIINVLDLKSNS